MIILRQLLFGHNSAELDSAYMSRKFNCKLLTNAVFFLELYGDKNFDLGPRWEQIKWINTHLQRYTALQEDWFYIENSEIFLRQDDPAYINKTLMADALHPTVEGYKLWATLLSKPIQDILAMRGSQ